MKRDEWTFDNFEVNLYNRNAYQIAKEFIKKPMKKGMTLSIFGLKGTGKTKLLQAIANYYMEKNSETIVYITERELYQQLENAIKRKDIFILSLKWKFRKAEVVCLDGVSELLIDERIQPWFMHWFHHCKRRRKRMIYTHDCDEKMYCVLQELAVLDERAIFVGIPKEGQNRNMEVINILD